VNDPKITHTEALQYVEHILTCLQKLRSIVSEDSVKDGVSHWISEPTLIEKITDALNRGRIEPMEFYNLMVVVTFEPLISVESMLQNGKLPTVAEYTSIVVGFKPE
jgi:hypothetical protein